MRPSIVLSVFVLSFPAVSFSESPFSALFRSITNSTTVISEGCRDCMNGLSKGLMENKSSCKVVEETKTENGRVVRRKTIYKEYRFGGDDRDELQLGKQAVNSTEAACPNSSAEAGSVAERERLTKAGLYDDPPWVTNGLALLLSDANRSLKLPDEVALEQYDKGMEYGVYCRWQTDSACRKEISYEKFVEEFCRIETVLAPDLAGMVAACERGVAGDEELARLCEWNDSRLSFRSDQLEWFGRTVVVSADSEVEKSAVVDIKRAACALVEACESFSALGKFDACRKHLENYRGIRRLRLKSLPQVGTVKGFLEASVPLQDTQRGSSEIQLGCAREGVVRRIVDERWTMSHLDDKTFSNLPRQRNWYALPLRLGFPIKTMCGFELGQTAEFNRRNANAVEVSKFRYVSYAPDTCSFHYYRLKRPFGAFTHAMLRYEYPFNNDSLPKGMDVLDREEVEGLLGLRLEGEISREYSRASILQELVQKKSVIEKKYGVDLGNGTEQKDWYGSDIGGRGRVQLGLIDDPKFSNYLIVLDVNYSRKRATFNQNDELLLFQQRLRRFRNQENDRSRRAFVATDGDDVL